ncbi:hypothetical protein EYF80_056029 [Liparis tanakae]|uniref:Uncharacterized protein n=1 Tax=Liparis tanakae TaxID=230148 RepID=A0A4Z2EY61_9TELE|nr:hypothetical protein EYF80_056029 [Liparis tanakae]
MIQEQIRKRPEDRSQEVKCISLNHSRFPDDAPAFPEGDKLLSHEPPLKIGPDVSPASPGMENPSPRKTPIQLNKIKFSRQNKSSQKSVHTTRDVKG